MKPRTLSLLCLLSFASIVATSQNNSSPNSPKPAPDYGKLPLSFEANQGQVDAQVRFTSRGNGYSLFLTDKEAVLALSKREKSKGAAKPAGNPGALPGNPAKGVLKTDVVRMQLAGADPGLRLRGEQQLPGIANYFIGSDPAKWRAGIPTYAKVKYAAVYPGVDLVYYGNQGRLEYDFVVAPGAEPKQVKLHFAGVKKLKLSANGDLMIVGKNGEIAFHKPAVYQSNKAQQSGAPADRRQPIEGKFMLLAKNTVGFELGLYDRSQPLIIDPTLAYSTYLGVGLGLATVADGNGGGGGYAGAPVFGGIALDSSGNTYITGGTDSASFPVTKGAFQTALNGTSFNAFVAKLNPSGSSLIYSTYLGGSVANEGDYGSGIAIDASGDAYITGSALSTNFPVTKDAFQKVNKAAASYEANAFVTKLDPAGSSLIYSTYLGGSGDDESYGIALDQSGDAYVTGQNSSKDFPLTGNAFQTVIGGAFLTEFAPSGASLIYSTYLGGSAGDFGTGIVVDAAGNVYLTGTTYSTNFPVTKGAFQTVNHGAPSGLSNIFVTKLNPATSSLIYSTYLGGSGSSLIYSEEGDFGSAIAVDVNGNAYLTGTAYSIDFPITKDAFQTVNPGPSGYGSDAFVTKLNPTGSALVYSTYLGGSGGPVPLTGYPGDSGLAIALDRQGDAYVTGVASSPDFPVTAGAFQTTNPSFANIATNGFLTKLNPTGTSLIYSTYFGGSGVNSDPSCRCVSAYGDQGLGIAVDAAGNAYLTGSAASPNFPVTKGALQTTQNTQSNYDGFVAKFSFNIGVAIDFSKGFAGAQGPIQFNGSTTVDGSHLQLTGDASSAAGSAFYTAPVNIASFTTGFRFQLTSPGPSTPLANIADGFTFTIQNAFPDALGEYGKSLGYAPMGKSVAVKFDLHNNDGEGPNSTGLYTDGAPPTVPAIDLTGTGIDLHSGDPFYAYITYNGVNLSLSLVDATTAATYTHSFAIDIPTTVGGNTAYVGFTAGTGADTAVQQIIDWTFTNP